VESFFDRLIAVEEPSACEGWVGGVGSLLSCGQYSVALTGPRCLFCHRAATLSLCGKGTCLPKGRGEKKRREDEEKKPMYPTGDFGRREEKREVKEKNRRGQQPVTTAFVPQ